MEKNITKGPVLAIDWGSKRIGLAISDISHTLARPLRVIEHTSRSEDAEKIISTAIEQSAGCIVVGVNYDGQSEPTVSGRSALRLLKEIQNKTTIAAIDWDETDSTREAIATRLKLGIGRKNRTGHHDGLAAAIILQHFLDSRNEDNEK